MKTKTVEKSLSCLRSVVVVAGSIASFSLGAADGKDYAQATVEEVIDDLAQIDSQSQALNSAVVFDGFIANDSPGSFQVGVLGVNVPDVPPQMRELVRRGPKALPALVTHISDARPTKLKVGNDNAAASHAVGVNFFMFTVFSNEYRPRLRDLHDHAALANMLDFKGQYTVKIGDVCFVLIGQIVNRRLLAIRYQPSAGLVVNSPIETPILARWIREDWGKGDEETLKESLLDDANPKNCPREMGDRMCAEFIIDPALKRLKLYFPNG